MLGDGTNTWEILRMAYRVAKITEFRRREYRIEVQRTGHWAGFLNLMGMSDRNYFILQGSGTSWFEFPSGRMASTGWCIFAVETIKGRQMRGELTE